MNLFYIYAIWCELGNKNSTEWSRVVIVFPSRQDADEYFRALQDLKQDSGANMFALLSRRSPQFWLYSIPGVCMMFPSNYRFPLIPLLANRDL